MHNNHISVNKKARRRQEEESSDKDRNISKFNSMILYCPYVRAQAGR